MRINENAIRIGIFAAAGLFLLLWLKGCSDLRDAKAQMRRNEEIAAQNARALTDSVRIERTKNGELEAVKSSFVTRMDDLERLNKDLYAEVRKEMGTVKSLIKAQGEIGRDSVKMANTLKKYPDGKTYGLRFRDNYEDTALTWRLSGESRFSMDNNTIYPGTTTIEENTIKLKVVMGFKEDKDGNYEVFARSASPFVRFNDLDGVLIIPKKADLSCPPAKNKRFGLGPNISVGIGSNLKPSIFLGFGLQYNIIRF